MDDPNITMEEYIRLDEGKAQKCGKVFNWETAKYGNIYETLSCEPTVSSLNDNEIDFRISFDESDDEDYTNEFPTIVYNDALTSKSNFSIEPTLCLQHIDDFDLKDETSLSEYVEEEHNVLYFNDLFLFYIIYLDDLKSDKNNDDNEIDMIQSSGVMAPLLPHDQRHLWLRYQVNRVHILDFDGLTPDMRHDLSERMRMVYTGDDGQEVFVSHAWRRFFEIRAPLVHEFLLEFNNTCRIGDEMGLDAVGLHTAEEMAEDGFRGCWLGSERVIPDKGDLSDYLVEILFGRDFLGGAPSYTYIRDPVHRLLMCYRVSWIDDCKKSDTSSWEWLYAFTWKTALPLIPPYLFLLWITA
ncbi:hypothetical protein Tco_0015148 [Tanacetum coccineum]